MRRPVRNLLISAVAVTALVAVYLATVSVHAPDVRDVLAALAAAPQGGGLTILYPLDETVLPPELPGPLFRWKEDSPHLNRWLVSVELPDGGGRISLFVDAPEWRPQAPDWEQITKQSVEKWATVTVVGIDRGTPSHVLSVGRVRIQTSSDAVGAPLFYREVNLPFADAVRDPSRIRWRFGAISSLEPPAIVLERLPVCGNCHSFSADGAVLGMDVDYANDKGSYAIVPVGKEMTLDRSTVITWGDYRRVDGEVTYGLLSQVSPDGRFVVSTVKDESVFVAKPNLDFSQLFFPVKGILCIYDRQTRTFRSLPGADAPSLVQSNPTWSPDGKYIVYAATEAYRLRSGDGPRGVLLSPDECREFLVEGKPFKFNLYRIPFNNGQGGAPEPLAGASFNGQSNFFPRYSPDGKWIVFCKAANYMLLQPDSELHIIPAEGGEARRLRANTTRMNSWHSFSPNGKWLVFSGKPDSAYTKLYLTHIDEQGESSPPVVLDHLTSPDRAANIPEFVNASPVAIRQIRERFVDDLSYVRAAWEFLKSNDYDGAERQARKALELNPKNADALYYLGLAMFGQEQYDEAIDHMSEAAELKPRESEIRTQLGVACIAKGQLDRAEGHLLKAVKIAPDNSEAYFNLGVAMYRRGDRRRAIENWQQAVQIRPNDYEAHHNLGLAFDEEGNKDRAIEHYRRAVGLKPDHGLAQAALGVALCVKGIFPEGVQHLSAAVDLDPNNTTIRFNLAITLARLKQHDQAIAHLSQILQRDPNNTEFLQCLAASYAETGQTVQALATLDRALQIAQAAGNRQLIAQITAQIERCKRAFAPAGGGGR
ncbi:MAG: tetratricopeptide repeat protein [Phycisphaerae bacterium]|nr:tetratricopeptide repeat protein [Phycisphaerae bacterium]